MTDEGRALADIVAETGGNLGCGTTLRDADALAGAA